MQTKPAGWDALFAASHKTEYKFVIDGETYTANSIRGTPIITKPYMNKLCIGQCCSGTLKLPIRSDNAIPKAAEVVAYCRLVSLDGLTVTDWLEQGHYYISSRKQNGEILTLTCRDAMIKAGADYLSHTALTEWPAAMSAVVSEIASLMGVEIDERTEIYTGVDYAVSYPNDLLMSEVLSMIAAAHGGNFVITEQNRLRLLPVVPIQTGAVNKFAAGSHYQTYESVSNARQISRVTLEDDAENQYSAGTDTGVEVTAKCNYATQAIADKLCAPESGVLYGVEYVPYSLKGVYLDPCAELGDQIEFSYKGTGMLRMAGEMTIRCNISYNADISCKSEVDDEDEFPYISARDLQASRYIRTDQKYHGNRIDRVNGFTSEYTVNDQVTARMVANSNVFSMQRVVDGAWEDCIYFDAATQKYVITGNVTIKGVITAESLATAGQTTINGANITTGTLSASRVDLSSYSTTTEITSMLDGLSITAADNAFTGQLSVTSVSGATYGFNLESDGYYTSTNAGVDNTYSICRISVSGMSSASILTLSCISYGESSYDFGVIGKIDTELSTTITDSDAVIYKSFKGLSSANATDIAIEIPAGSHYFYIKYRKDGSQSTYGDYFKFKKVDSGGQTSILFLKRGSIELSSAIISFTGAVTFNDLATAGATIINGANITTGMISAERIDVSTLRVKEVYYYDGSSYYSIVSAATSGNNSWTHIGPKDINNGYGQYMTLYGTQIYLTRSGYTPDTDSRALMIDMENSQIVPFYSGRWDLGTDEYTISEIHSNRVYSGRYYFDDGSRLQVGSDGVLKFRFAGETTNYIIDMTKE